jgi:hypothetical protein
MKQQTCLRLPLTHSMCFDCSFVVGEQLEDFPAFLNFDVSTIA